MRINDLQYLVIIVFILMLCAGLLAIQERSYQREIKRVREAPKIAVESVLKRKAGSYYVKEIGAFISHYNHNRWDISNKRRY